MQEASYRLYRGIRTKQHLDWKNPFLGHNIDRRISSRCKIIKELLQKTKYVGVANGRAEFGPRALGNRSLISRSDGD